MSTSYKLDVVPAKVRGDGTLILDPGAYLAPVGQNCLLSYSRTAQRKPTVANHQHAKRLAEHYYNRQCVILASAYTLEKRDFVVTNVYRITA